MIQAQAVPPKTPSKPATPKRPPGRKSVEEEPMEVTSLRLPRSVVERLDAWVEQRNATPPSEPTSPLTRSALVLHILRAALDARDAKGKADA